MHSLNRSSEPDRSLAVVAGVGGALVVADLIVIALRGVEASLADWVSLGVGLVGLAAFLVVLLAGGLHLRGRLKQRLSASRRACVVMDAMVLQVAETVCAVLLFAPVWSELAVTYQAASIVGLLGLIGSILIASALLRSRRDVVRKSSAVAGLLLAAVLYVVDATVLVGLYPAFHAGLFFAVVWFGSLSAATLLPGRLRLPARRVLPVLGAMALYPVFALSYFPETALVIATNAVAHGQLLHAGRAVTDFDADGYSNLFGGGDCAAFRSDISPEGFDVPDNGLDEDCSGADLGEAVAEHEREQLYPLDGGPYNVVLVLVDALRADHVGALGYSRNTTPNIDRLASKSQVFSRAYSQSPKTGTSVPSILTGRFPSNLVLDFSNPKLRAHAGILHESHRTLTERLSAAGYRTVAGDGNGFYRRYQFGQGFDKIARKRFKRLARETLRKKRKKPAFLMLHVMYPHLPYRRHKSHDFGEKRVDLYDGEVATADAFVGSLIDMLRAEKQLEQTIFILSADHGESLGEMGRENHIGVHEETVHVPLIMYVPGLEPRKFDQVTPLVDVVPTVLELLGLPQSTLVDGHSRAPEFFGVSPVPSPPGVAVSQRRDRRGLVHNSVVRENYRLTVRRGSVELIDIQRDREGRRNLAEKKQKLAHKMRDLLAFTTQATDSSLIRRARKDGAGLERLRRHVHLLSPPEQLRRALDLLEAAGDLDAVKWSKLLGRKDLPDALRKRVERLAAKK